jgi:hypothetical protein
MHSFGCCHPIKLSKFRRIDINVKKCFNFTVDVFGKKQECLSLARI